MTHVAKPRAASGLRAYLTSGLQCVIFRLLSFARSAEG